MRDFYFPALRLGPAVELPAILGLSASPVSSARICDLE
jgi:hypothetical protein